LLQPPPLQSTCHKTTTTQRTTNDLITTLIATNGTTTRPRQRARLGHQQTTKTGHKRLYDDAQQMMNTKKDDVSRALLVGMSIFLLTMFLDSNYLYPMDDDHKKEPERQQRPLGLRLPPFISYHESTTATQMTWMTVMKAWISMIGDEGDEEDDLEDGLELEGGEECGEEEATTTSSWRMILLTMPWDQMMKRWMTTTWLASVLQHSRTFFTPLYLFFPRVSA